MKKKIIVASMIILAIAVVLYIFRAKEIEPVENYVIENNIITNNEQGYSFAVPEGFSVNEDYYPFNMRLESENTVIEIYQEDYTGDMLLAYLDYTNEAITENKTDYFNVSETQNGGLRILKWERKKLSKLLNDKNHYMKIDICSSDMVHTLLIKSSDDIADYKEYYKLFKKVQKKPTIQKEFPKRQPSNRLFNDETKTFYDEKFVNSNTLTWGIFHPEFLKNDSLKEFEKTISHNFEIALWYVGFTEEYNSTTIGEFLEKTYADGKIAEMTLQPLLEHEEGNDIFKLLDGKYDKFLDDCAKAIADFNHPVLFRLANEMNGDWCEYSAYRMSLDTELYREFYKYVYGFFEKNNADNVIWIFNPNGKSFPDFKWNSEDMYYPGNVYVDIYGLTLYNTGNYYDGEKWTEFSDLYDPLYEKSKAKYDMPFMITEFACARAGGNKEKWTEKMLEDIKKYDKIKAAVWWNSADFASNGEISRAYYIDDSEEMTGIFKKYFSDNK